MAHAASWLIVFSVTPSAALPLSKPFNLPAQIARALPKTPFPDLSPSFSNAPAVDVCATAARRGWRKRGPLQRPRRRRRGAWGWTQVAAAWGGGVRAGEGCSRQADESKAVGDRFIESFTRRQREKERAAAEVALAPAGGRGHPAARAGKGCSGRGRGKRAGNGCSRRPNVEVEYDPCAVALDHEAVKTWIYPTNVEVREYQKYMVAKALFTLIALPTGLGKTFIAAVVMYNYFRWFPEGKIIFTCPSRPFVTQQIEACYNTEWIIDMKGGLCPSTRSVHWKSKRVFFVTPQVLQNDIQSGICMVQQIVCLVIDEAHKASGNYAYCMVIRELLASRVPLRILALTATPGSKQSKIQSVIDNLSISELIYCDEEDSRVNQYVNTRKVEVVQVPSGSDATQVADMLLDIVRPHLNRLHDAGVIDHRDYANWTQYELLKFKDKFKEAPPPNIHEIERGETERSFVILGPLCHTRRLPLSHGTQFAHGYLDKKLKGGYCLHTFAT
ncbi:unnamed protein product [Miscanthus lutarioriparius]|uniref:Helicase ATP-binding domain-containing protein n=1 Tax=Miscanthus lutarioriparius TaxID=422564 RepID=A0A811QCP6_9POAL|nr:unnamed protein product [Miscanthus lutarioriparius]